VSKRAEKNPDFIDSVYTYIGTLVSKALSEIQTSNWKTVGHYMDLDQDALVKLEVSSTMLDEMIHAARNAGAYGAKLSGAGGGDCMIALVSEEKRQAVSDAITSVGGKVIDIPTNVEGVRVETM